MQTAVTMDLTVEHDSSEYTERWPFIKPSTRGTVSVYVFCNICKALISIKSCSYDIKIHIKMSKHVGLAKSVASNKNIQSMFCSNLRIQSLVLHVSFVLNPASRILL